MQEIGERESAFQQGDRLGFHREPKKIEQEPEKRRVFFHDLDFK